MQQAPIYRHRCGIVSGAQQFNGTSDKITAPRIAAYDFAANSSFTFETWINHPAGSYTKEEVIIERKPSSGSLVINLKFNSTKVTFFSKEYIRPAVFSYRYNKSI